MNLLRKYERASEDTVLVKQGQEGNDFWQMFGIQKHQKPTSYVADWSHLFIDVSLFL